MVGREFLATADRLSKLAAESDWRSAISRAYYGLYLECREAMRRWGFVISQRGSHREVGQRLSWPRNPDLTALAVIFQGLSGLRNKADYDLGFHPEFATDSEAKNSVIDARTGVALLDALAADRARLSRAIADIRAVFP